VATASEKKEFTAIRMRQGICFSGRSTTETCVPHVTITGKKFQLLKAARLRTTQDTPDSYFGVYTYNPIEEWNEMSQTMRRGSKYQYRPSPPCCR
jgi:hypothetical protein